MSIDICESRSIFRRKNTQQYLLSYQRQTTNSRNFTYIIYYHVTRKKNHNKQCRDAKSSFIFLENDDDQEVVIFHRLYRYDYRIIGNLDFADLLYQDHRYRTNKYSK